MRKTITMMTILIGAAWSGGAAPPASAQTCHDRMQELPCWGDDRYFYVAFSCAGDSVRGPYS